MKIGYDPLSRLSFQMRLLPWLIVILAFAFVVKSNPVAKPIHGVLEYYKKQQRAQIRLQNSKLRHRCESQLRSGYVSDRECQLWISKEFNNASPKISTSFLLTIFTTVLFLVI